MGMFGLMGRSGSTTKITRQAMKGARSQPDDGQSGAGEALRIMTESFRDIGLNGALKYSSAKEVAHRASRKSRGDQKKAIRRIVRQHRRGVTAAGFLTGLGGVFTLALLLPANIFEFYVQATRMVGGIATIRGYDLDDEEVRSRVLAALVGEESDDVLAGIGLGPIAGTATRAVTKRLPSSPSATIAQAVGGRVLRRFGLQSVRLFGKAIPGLGGVIGAWSDRGMLKKIAKTAKKDFPGVG